jgi:6-bladed beta-propeller
MTTRHLRKTIAAGVGACVVAASVPDASAAQQPLVVDTLFEVGVLEGDACQTFGRIGSAAVDAAGRVVVVDELNRAVRVFGRDGRCLASIGRPGAGPGEFREPRRVRIHADTMHVLDVANVRIERFVLGSAAPELLPATPLRVVPEDFCFLGARLFVLAHHDGRAIHEIDAHGNPIRSFGTAADEQYPELGAVDADGYLLCDAAAGVVVHAVLQRPIVRAYGLDGVERWRVEIPGYRGVRITPGDNGSIRFTAPESGGLPDLTASLTAIHLDRALLQIGTVAGLRVFDAVRSFELDLATGSLAPLTVALPVILSSHADLLVASETDDYPNILLLRRDR